MLTPKRWISLKTVRHRILDHVSSKAGNEDCASIAEQTNTLCWQFCEASKAVYLLTFDDKVVEISKEYVTAAEAEKTSRSNANVDLEVGTVGSGTKSKSLVAVGTGRKYYQEYGPYLGCAIVFERKGFNSYMMKVDSPQHGLAPGSKAAVTKAILDAFNEGKLEHKTWAKEHLGAHVSKSLFNDAWKDAAKEAPRVRIHNQ